MERKFIDPETFNKEDIAYLTDIIVNKFNEFLDSLRDLEFMLEESPNKFRSIELDCQGLILELEDKLEKSGLLDDVKDLLEEEEEDEN